MAEKSDRKRSPPATPGAALVRAFVAFSLAWFMIPWLAGMLVTSGARWYGRVPLEARAQLRSIRKRLARGEADDMNWFFPEGRVFSYGFYGFSLVNMATATPGDAEFRANAIAELERVIPIVAAEVDAPRFLESKDLVPRGGIIPTGQANLLRAGYVLLGGKDAVIAREFHDTSAFLYAEFMKTRTGSLPTYPLMTWPVDNCCALESLRLHDVLHGTKYSAACRKWAGWMSANLDAESGMMVAQITERGNVLDGPRGCAISWSLALMPGFAPDLARSQYERYRSTWFIHVLGMTGAREWVPGREGERDVDTGPVVFGIGSAASGIGIAAAKANGDEANLTAMLRGMELASVPTWSPEGKRYFMGRLLLADELALWGKTIRVWDRPPEEDGPAVLPAPPLGWFWLVWMILLAACGAILFLTARSAARAFRRARGNPDRWRRPFRIVFKVELIAILAWIFVPWLPWIYAVFVSGLADTVEHRVIARSLEARDAADWSAGG